MHKSLQQHWNTIFQQRSGLELGWYESDISQTMKFFQFINEQKHSTIFLVGAGTSILVDQLLSPTRHLIINDLSQQALINLDQRIQNTEHSYQLLQHNLALPLADGLQKSDIWIDRAVLHFLLEEEQIQTYFDNLKTNLKPGGYALFAEFSKTGAKKCAGLELHRYSEEELSERLGEAFKLLHSEEYDFINPNGDKRPYIYALYQRK